jgi:hypothetical protein
VVIFCSGAYRQARQTASLQGQLPGFILDKARQIRIACDPGQPRSAAAKKGWAIA